MNYLEAFETTAIEAMTKDEIRGFIAAVEERCMEVPVEHHAQIPLQHHFSKDVYAREILIPKGSIVVGKIHKHENLNILSKGSLLLVSIDGVMKVEAPYTVVSSPGVKRLALALEDSVWTTIHGTAEKDLEKIEDEFIAKTYDDVPQLIDIKKIEGE